LNRITLLTLPPAVQGTVINNVDGTITFTPTADFNGTVDSFDYQVCDVLGLCDTATIYINVTPVNDPPIATIDSETTTEDTPIQIAVQDNDSDPEGDAITTTEITSLPTNGMVNIVNDSILYTPNPDFNGMDTLDYVICDNGVPSLCDTTQVIITISPVNDAPVAVNDTTTMAEDMPVDLNLVTNDTDFDNPIDPTSIALISLPPGDQGTVTNNGDGTITFTPTADFNGTVDAFDYQVCDMLGVCDTATIYINVMPVNDAPIAILDSETTSEDTPIQVAVQDNDSDPDGAMITTTEITSLPTNGMASIVNDSILYTPNSDFSGMDTLSYSICDNGVPSLCDTTQVIITITPVNDAPVAINDTTTTLEDVPVDLNLVTNDTDFDDAIDPTSITLLTLPPAAQGTVLNNADGTIRFTPMADFNGIVDSFDYKVCDVLGLCDTATIYIDVTPVNDSPVAILDSETTPEDTPIQIAVQDNDSDPEGDVITTTEITSLPTNGMASIVNDSILYTPNSGFSGMDTLSYSICDNGVPSLCDTTQIIIMITPVNDAPIAVNDTVTTTEDTPVDIALYPNDSDIDGNLNPTSASLLNLPPGNQGTVANNGDGTITFIPAVNFNGTVDSFDYAICDTEGLCDTATIYIDVIPANDSPIAADDSRITDEDTPIIIGVQDNDSDPEGDVLSTTEILIQPTNGTVSIVNDSIIYTPNPDFNGMDTLSYVICDNGAPNLCDTAEVVITVNPVNDSPTGGNELVSTSQNTTKENIDLLNNNIDPDGDVLIPTIPATSENGGIITNNPDGTINYIPPTDLVGLDTVLYQVCDPSGACVSDTLIIDIGGTTACVTITANVWLEGAYKNGEMHTKLNDLGYLPGQDPTTFFGTETPAGQPYGVAPWNYAGTEGETMDYYLTGTGDANYASTVTDWVLVSLRTGTDKNTTVCERAGLLHNDGRIELLPLVNCCEIDTTQSYYIVIEHRNHLIIMTPTPVSVIGGNLNFDFRAQQSYIGLLGLGQKQVAPGVYVMYGGNGEQLTVGSADTDINVGDKSTWLNENGDHSSYYFQDFDLNGDSNVQDKNLWLNNNGKFSDVPRGN